MYFDHLAINVENLEKAVAEFHFLPNSAKVLYQDETWAMLEYQGLKIALVTKEQHHNHLAFRVESKDELETLALKYSHPLQQHRDGSQYFYHPLPGSEFAVEYIWYPDQDRK